MVTKVYGYSTNSARYIGKMSKTKFDKLVAMKANSSVNWVKQRSAETGNFEELKLANENPDIIIKIGSDYLPW
jgi:hypothetical protein